MITFVIKHKDKYCAFGSYSKARLVDEPSKASLYSTKKLAEKRLGYAWIDGKQVTELKLVQLKLEVVEEQEL